MALLPVGPFFISNPAESREKKTDSCVEKLSFLWVVCFFLVTEKFQNLIILQGKLRWIILRYRSTFLIGFIQVFGII